MTEQNKKLKIIMSIPWAFVLHPFGPLSSTSSKSTENFKRPENREDSSDLDENLIETIAAMKTRIFSKFFGAFWAKNLKKLHENFANPSSQGSVDAP